ncbi:unnamed protein product, partial [Symbiodinium sp. CCMP2456]
DFVAIVKEKVQPVRKRQLHAEVLPGSLDFKEFFQQYGHSVAGLGGYDAQDGDCILLVKHLTNSGSLSQPPLTILPASFAKRLEKPLEVLPRNLLAERARKEWERFAPGPVRTVTVKQAAKAAEAPKQAARKRKADDIFSGESAGQGILAMPPDTVAEVPIAAEQPGPAEGPKWPERPTFAGRQKKGSETQQAKFDEMKAKFYGNVPEELWKDPCERRFWKAYTDAEAKGPVQDSSFFSEFVDAEKSKRPARAGNRGGRGRGLGRGKAATRH